MVDAQAVADLLRLAICIPDGFSHLQHVNAGIHAWIRTHGAESRIFAPSDDLSGVMHWADAALIQGGDPGMRRAFVDSGKPAVVVSGQTAPALLPSVVCDDRAIGRLAADHLRSLGLRHAAVYGIGDRSWLSQERIAGFIEGFPACTTVLSRREECAAWLETVNRPTGLFVVNDQVAVVACRMARERGIAVPGTVAIIGVDNDPNHSDLSPVPLTSIQLDGRRQGWQAAALAARLAGFPSADAPAPGAMLVKIPPLRVVVRQSSDVVHVADRRLAAFLRLIRDPDRQRQDVKTLCAACGLTRRTCERGLARHLGTSPARELERLRLERICQQLEDTDLPITAIARNSGYRSQRVFLRAFKRACGLTPGDWRHQHQGRYRASASL
jgi:LacI family transcriptional regulator